MYVAEKAAAKREVERTRKKLLHFASELSAEAASEEDCVVMLEPPQQQEDKKQQPPSSQGGRKKRKTDADSESIEHSISDWA
jgi:hypothetical protein